MKYLTVIALVATLVAALSTSNGRAFAMRRTPPDATPSAEAETPSPAATLEPPATPEPATAPATAGTPAAPLQPTIPDAMLDPSVRGTLARPIRELSQFRWMLGTWQTHAVAELGSGRSHDNGRDTYVFAMTMQNRWIFGADGRGTDYFYITFDPFVRRWVLLRFNYNPAYGIWTSPGWHQNWIVFTSDDSTVNGRRYRRRITIVRKDARTFGIYDEEQLPGGAWTPDESAELERPR